MWLAEGECRQGFVVGRDSRKREGSVPSPLYGMVIIT